MISLTKRVGEYFFSIVGYFFLTIFIVLGISYSIFMYAALILAIFMVLFEKGLTKQLSLLMYLLPFSNLFVRGDYGGYPYLLLIMILTVIKIAAKQKTIHKLYFVCTLLCVIDVILLSFSGMSVSLRGQFAIFGMLLVALFALSKEDFDIVFLSRVYTVAILVAIVLAFCEDFIPNIANYTYDQYLALDTVVRFCGLYKNPNYFTYDITIAIASILYICSLKKKSQLIDLILVVILCICGCLSVSMSFVLSTIIMIICFFLFSKDGIINFKAIIITLVLAIILFAIFNNTPVLSAILTRMNNFDFTQDGLSSTTTFRSDIWMDFVNRIFSDDKIFFLGAGINSTKESAHNFYIEYWYFFGLLGTVLFVVFVLMTVNRVKHTTNRRNINKRVLIFIIPVMFRAFGISLVAYINFWLSICFIISMLKYDNNHL